MQPYDPTIMYDFYKQNRKDKIWHTGIIDAYGPMLFSFDKKTVYNYWSDWEELTEEQKALYRKENPTFTK